MKRNITIIIILISSAIFFTCSSNKSLEKHNANVNMVQPPSNTLEDYLIFKGKNGNFSYSVYSYRALEQWFLTQTQGNSSEQIIDLYQQLPLIQDTDTTKVEYIIPLTKPILEQRQEYNNLYMALENKENVKTYMENITSYYDDLFPDLQIELELVINPFFTNGGMGVLHKKTQNKKMIGRLEIGPASLANGKIDPNIMGIFLAHEFTHVVHQIYVNSDEYLDETNYISNLPLFTEGVATYISSRITNNSIKHSTAIMLNVEYNNSNINDPLVWIPIAQQCLDTFIDKRAFIKDASGELTLQNDVFTMHKIWFSSKSTIESRNGLPLPVLGYFIGFKIIEYLINSGKYTEKTILNTPLDDVLPHMKEYLNALIVEASNKS